MITAQKPHRRPTDYPDPRSVIAREEELLHTRVRVVTRLSVSGLRFAVAGDCAAYAHGGPPAEHDVDIFVTRDDVRRASDELVAAGMRRAGRHEDRLNKIHDGDRVVNLTFRRPDSAEVTDLLLDRASPMRIGTTTAAVIGTTDLLIDRLRDLGTRRCDFVPTLQIARALREPVD
ncbi:hypothetical protein R1X32_09075 (plasmid) [Rhodococcus opacus]|uniref:hypothetical protein n=1 Tax=Rhodococcus opacus TaxID=37919 RepID=UPI0002A2ECFE|nr:hypothetical protein [Rhodococcus opacus]ELB88317.1 hypothetical protein Rwratislav_35319 [Rhodococcus wratislaviensis IFP 2016]MDV6248073.1 hypothetical protein [Rhodococcus opacus]WKN59887.1 hypothetical protein HJ581_0039225 [Rhodococcus opacus]